MFLHELCKLKLTCIDTECHQADFFFKLSKEHLCPVIYVCTIRLYPLSTLYVPYLSLYISLCFCINYANEVYLHSIFSVEKCNYIKHTHANLKIAKKNTAVMIDTFFSRICYALMSNLCKLRIHLHNN